MNKLIMYIKKFFFILFNFIIVTITLFFILNFINIFISIFNIKIAYNFLCKFYYDKVLKACYCDKIGFNFPMSFLNFQINFPFICFKNLGNHRLKDVRRLYWYIVIFYNIPLYFLFFFFFLIIILYLFIFFQNVYKYYKNVRKRKF
jgi:hypothetical protein